MGSGDRFLETLADAIRIPTIAHDDRSAVDQAAFDRLHSLLEERYPLTFAISRTERISEHGLLLTLEGSVAGDTAMVLASHQDVVPASEEDGWSRPPFAGERTATHLLGRGAIDAKGSLVALLEAVEGLIADGYPFRRGLVLALGHDEETMGTAGAATMAAILQERGVRAELVVDEGGFVTEGVVPGTRRPVALVGISEKGYLDVEISAVGVPGHSSAPPRVTAIGKVAAAVAALQKRPLPARVEMQAAFFAAAAAGAPKPLRPLFGLLPRMGRLTERLLARRPSTDALVRTTTAPTIIEGGVKSNVLPASARAVVNFRLLPGDTVDSVMEHVASTVGDDVTVTRLQGWDPPPVATTATRGFTELAGAIEEVFPEAVVAPWIVIGATDARYYTGISDTVLRFVPFRMTREELDGFHGVDERIRLSDAEPAVRFYRRLIERVCGEG